MTTVELLRLAESQGYNVIYGEFPESGSLAVKGETEVIGIDRHLTGSEERIHLAHEVGHCETGSFYNIHTKLQSLQKCEYNANKWAVENLIPFDKYKKAVLNRCRTDTEFAECWDIAIRFVSEVHRVYERTHWNEVLGVK